MPSDDAKAAKKEEETDDKSLSSILESRKKKPSNGRVKKEEPTDQDDNFDKPLRKVAKVKKEENAIDYDDYKPISKADNKELKKKNGRGEKKKAEAQQNDKKKEKKVYDLPGQKRDPPEERDSLRIFYETLYKQVPHSEMAQIWMMESGLLAFDEAKKAFERKQMKNQQAKITSPQKVISGEKRTTESVSVKKRPLSSPDSSKKKTTDSKVAVKQSKKHKVNNGYSEDDSDDDFSIKKAAKKQKAK